MREDVDEERETLSEGLFVKTDDCSSGVDGTWSDDSALRDGDEMDERRDGVAVEKEGS